MCVRSVGHLSASGYMCEVCMCEVCVCTLGVVHTLLHNVILVLRTHYEAFSCHHLDWQLLSLSSIRLCVHVHVFVSSSLASVCED